MASAMEANFVRALKKPEQSRDKEALDTIYWFLHSMEVLSCLREPALRSICRSVRYQYSAANEVLYSAGDKATCWYILLSGSVFIEGSMFLPRQSFGKRTAGCARRVNECLTLEASEMIVIDYPDVTLMTQPQTSAHHHHHHHTKRKYNAHNSHNIERLLAATTISNHDTKVAPPTICHTRCKSDSSVQQLPVELQGVQNMLQKSEQLLMLRSDTTTSLPSTTSVGTPTKRHSRASDTSSAYSGSDMTTQSLSVAGDDADIDLSCLRESSVDSDDDENLDTTESLIVRDTVRECLEKDPGERTEDDIEVLLDFLQHLLAFANMTLATRRALCAVMVFAVVDKAGTVVMKDGEELDSWSVILNGHVEVMRPDGTIEHLHMGDSFGITPTMEKLYHSGVMRTKVDDCQFVCIAQSDYYNILHQGEENTRRHKEGDEVVLVTEHRVLDGGNRKGYIVIRGTVDRLINHLVEQHSAVDPTYVEDFLLTHRAFLKSPLLVAEKLLVWFSDPKLRDRVTRVVLLWVNNHFNDFEMHSEMTDFLEKFEYMLKKEHMGGQLRLLNIACAAKARVRTVVVTRTTRQEILHFSVLGGLERGCGIFISNVEPGSKALEAGLKRGDQILEVNNHNFEHISHHCALEVLRGTTHLSINVKSNLLAFNEKLVTPDNSPGHKRKREQIAKLQNDPRQRLSASDLDKVSIVPPFINTPGRERGGVEKKERRFMSTGHKAKIRKALMRMNLLPRSGSSDSQLTNYDETSMSSSSSLSTQYYKRSISANSSPLHTPHLSASNPDLTSLGQYTDSGSSQPDYPEHVLKVYRADQSCKFFLVHRETTAHEVVMLVLNEFGITDPSSNYSLCEVSVDQGGVIKQKRLPDQLANLPDRIGLSSRYYLKNNMTTDTLVPDDLAGEMLKEGQVSLLQLNAAELAAQLTLRDFHYFHEIEPTEYIDDLFGLNSDCGAPKLATFSKFVNQEMFWVVSEVCRETNIMKRVKIIKNFIRCARHCKECKNFNSMFAIVSGLGHGSVSRLRSTWDKVPTKYAKMFTDLQDLMDPSRNMSNYRNLVNSEMVQPPLIPFFPVVKKDLTFIHLGNDSKVDGLINFEKLRMIAKEVRHVCAMASVQYDAHNMFLSYNTSQNMFFGGMTTLRRKRRNSAAPNPKKMHEEAQMVRQVRAYLVKVNIIDNETELNKMSQVCETASGGARKRDPSPSVSNGLDDRRYMHLGPKFGGARSVKSKQPSVITIQKTLLGAESPDAVRKLMSLSDKVRPHNSKQNPLPPTSHVPVLRANTVPVVGGRMAPVSPRQLRVPAVPLTAESSSVGSFAFRKPHSSGSVCSNDSHQSQQSLHSPTTETTFQLGHYDTDSGHNSIVSSNYDSHSSSSVGSTSSPPIEKRPPAIMVAPNMVAVTTVTSSSASTTVSHCQVRSSAVQSAAGTPPSSPHSQSRSYCDPQCPSTSSVARPPLPPYHVIVQNNPAYSEYIQQHYPVLNEHPVDYPSERPPLPDYHTATTMAAHRMPPSHQPLHHARSRSYDPTYFEPDLVDDYDDAEEQVSAV